MISEHQIKTSSNEKLLWVGVVASRSTPVGACCRLGWFLETLPPGGAGNGLRMPLQLTLLAGVCSGYLVQPSLTLMQVFRSQAWVLKIGWPCPGAVGLGGKTSSK